MSSPILKLLSFLFLAHLLFNSCKTSQPLPSVGFDQKITANPDLKAHSQEFKKEVIEVAEGIHVAIGYGLANSIMIEGTNGVIIVDCMGSMETGEEVKREFLQITDKPVKALIYTHNHGDHIFGAKALAGEDKPEVYSHELTNYYIDRLLSVVLPIITLRSYRMFGMALEEDQLVNCGIGNRFELNNDGKVGLLRPTKTFTDKLELEIEGVKIQLVHAPGETNDQLFVWLEDRKILLPGDNIYKSFPNLYTIRGTPYRDLKEWSRSLDKMRYLNPEIMIPSHTRPLVGKDTIQKVLTTYRDGIQFIHDQTIRNINKKMLPEELVQTVTLPPHLANSPWLQEFYGNAEWSVKTVFSGYLGFFDGNPTTLFTIPPKERAQEMASLAGGSQFLLVSAQKALEEKKYTWVLELTDHLKQLDVDQSVVSQIRYEALVAWGEQQINSNARHYLLMAALEEKGLEIQTQRVIEPSTAHGIPIASIFDNMSVKLIPEKSLHVQQKVVFHFEDLSEDWTVFVRNGVAEIQAFALPDPDMEVTINSLIWKELVARIRGGLATYASGKLKVQGGGIGEFKQFMDMFRE